jgi:hypothetical protein
MPTQENSTPLVRVGVEVSWPPRVKPPTCLSLPILQGLWVVAGLPVLIPRGLADLAVCLCLPLSWLLARLLWRKGVLRAPTALTFLASNSTPMLIVAIGIPVNLQIAPHTAQLKVVLAAAQCAALLIQDLLSRKWPADEAGDD